MIAAEGDECGPKPPSNAIVDTLSGVDLAGRGAVPDAALHISERGSDLVGLFRCNASYCPDHDYHRWEVGQSSAWLIARMTKTLNLLTSQEAFAQSHPDQIGSIDSQYVTAGRAIFDNVFYSEQDDPALSTVVSRMRGLASEGRRRIAADGPADLICADKAELIGVASRTLEPNGASSGQYRCDFQPARRDCRD